MSDLILVIEYIGYDNNFASIPMQKYINLCGFSDIEDAKRLEEPQMIRKLWGLTDYDGCMLIRMYVCTKDSYKPESNVISREVLNAYILKDKDNELRIVTNNDNSPHTLFGIINTDIIRIKVYDAKYEKILLNEIPPLCIGNKKIYNESLIFSYKESEEKELDLIKQLHNIIDLNMENPHISLLIEYHDVRLPVVDYMECYLSKLMEIKHKSVYLCRESPRYVQYNHRIGMILFTKLKELPSQLIEEVYDEEDDVDERISGYLAEEREEEE